MVQPSLWHNLCRRPNRESVSLWRQIYKWIFFWWYYFTRRVWIWHFTPLRYKC